MRHVLLAALLPLLTLSQTALADGFEDLLTRLNIMPQSGRQAVVDSLMANLPGGETPIREADRAWFLYLGSATSLSLAGDMTGWSPDLDFIPLAGTTLWTLRFLCEEDARLDYKFVRNGSSWILDPLNPHTCSGGFGPNSELAMPAYVQPEEIQNQGLPNGTLVTWTAFHSPQLNNTWRASRGAFAWCTMAASISPWAVCAWWWPGWRTATPSWNCPFSCACLR
jgi:hypothetical protein